MIQKVLIVLLIVALGSVAVLTLLAVFSRRPDALGATDGELAKCPASPNCVCSQDDDAGHAIAPFAFTGDANQAWETLRKVVAAWPRTTVIKEEEGYLHAECKSRVFGYVDDVEFLLDRDAKVIHVRSASRAGHSDLGVNRARVEGLRYAFGKE